MIDVARLAGLSTATVSRVLAGTDVAVRPETRARVRDAADHLGYRPNRLPRYLRARAIRTIGLVVGDIGNPFFTAIAKGCEDVAQAEGYSLILTSTDEDIQREDERLDNMEAERVAGVILASTGIVTPALRRLANARVPIVAVDRLVAGIEVDRVLVDNESASYAATRHLLDLGHKRIGFIRGPTTSVFEARLAGYRRALRQYGVASNPALISQGDLHESGGFRGTRDLLGSSNPPSAIFSSNNLTTIGVLRALRELGKRTPMDLSLIGFDDIPTGELLEPPLTVVVQPTTEIGYHAARLLFRRMSDPGVAIKEVVLQATLTVRGSTGMPPQPA